MQCIFFENILFCLSYLHDVVSTSWCRLPKIEQLLEIS